VDLDKLRVPSDVQDAFKAAVVTLVERDRLPCNISCINDVMKQSDRSWHFSRAGVNAFRQLAGWFEKEGSIRLTHRDATVMLSSTKWSEGVKVLDGYPRRAKRSRSPPRRYSPPRYSRRSRSRSPRRWSPRRRSPAHDDRWEMTDRDKDDGDRWHMGDGP